MPDASLEQRIRSRMESIRANQLERTLRPPSGIDLSSNDYLDLSSHPQLKQAMADAVFREGVGSTGSRLLRGDRTVFADVERRFAAFKGTERALYFSSGYLANLAVLTTLAEKGDVILSDERNHASLIDASRLSRADRVVFPHNDAAAVAETVRTVRLKADATPASGQRFVVTESLFSMDGDVAPLRRYAEVCRDTGATLIVDEAHAVGVYGARGSGLLEDLGVDANACISINAAGKALGVAGAFVCGPTWAIEYLVQRARPFIFSTAPPPPVAAALSAGLDVMAAEPERRTRLATRVARLHDALDAHGLVLPCARSHIVPIVIGDNDRTLAAAAALQAEGFDVRAIRPPSVPPGTARLRISINAGLDDDTIDRFAEALARVFRKVVLASASSASSAVESFNA
jgi:8-amino-7-oxononanoate synthase